MRIRRHSALHVIDVIDAGGIRTLELDGNVQSTMRIDDPLEGALELIDFLHLPVAFHPFATRVLFIGLGGGSAPKQFLHDYPQMQLDVVEIDEEVVRVAREFFGVEESERCVIHTGDALEFLKRSDAKWDVIVVDAYATVAGTPVIPDEISNAAFMKLCSDHLTGRGIVAVNCAAGIDARLTRRIEESVREQFATTLRFEVASSHNVVVIASLARLRTDRDQLLRIVREALDAGVVKREVLVRRVKQVVAG